jgi:hypothetical protein
VIQIFRHVLDDQHNAALTLEVSHLKRITAKRRLIAMKARAQIFQDNLTVVSRE